MSRRYRAPRYRCCSEILVEDENEIVRRYQSVKLGIYRYLETSSFNGRDFYKHCDENIYLYYDQDQSWKGWMFGPEKHGITGGIVAENDARCPEDVPEGSWIFFSNGNFRNSPTLRVNCFIEGKGKK